MNQPRIWPTAVAAGAIALGLLAQPANAQDPSDSATGTVQVSEVIRSVSVSPDAFDFDTCFFSNNEPAEALTFPNGHCSHLDRITVTNGDVPAHIHVRASEFEGSEGGPTWALVPGGDPGEDEARLSLAADAPAGFVTSIVTTNDTCDIHWAPDNAPEEKCAAAPNQNVNEQPSVTGPSASTNTSPSFSTTITWTAMP